MPTESDIAALRSAIRARLETIVDPCSAAAGAPAGLVSMGLVGDLIIEEGQAGAHIDLTLFITEPGCVMGAVFQQAAQRELASLPGVGSVEVRVDYAHVWDREQMTPAYRRRLTDLRSSQSAHMTALRRTPQSAPNTTTIGKHAASPEEAQNVIEEEPH